MEQENNYMMTPGEVANYLRISEEQVRRLAREGRIGVKVGSLWRFDRSDLLQFATRDNGSDKSDEML